MKRQILIDVLSRKPPDTLYHYTTQAGLLGIVGNKEIWATHSQYLNDQREYIHALEMVHQEIESFDSTVEDQEHKTLLAEMADDVTGNENINVCVYSFSEDGDSLSQWRAYGSVTSGYAIGFSGELLLKVSEKYSFYLAPCLYNLSEQHMLIRALVEEVLEENIAGVPWDDAHHIPRGGNLCAYLTRYAPILKHPSFSAEREWRGISRPLSCRRERFGFRQGTSMLIPFYRLALADEHIPFDVREIVVGPTPHPEQAKRSVSSFLMSQGLGDVSVINSVVPYRNW